MYLLEISDAASFFIPIGYRKKKNPDSYLRKDVVFPANLSLSLSFSKMSPSEGKNQLPGW